RWRDVARSFAPRWRAIGAEGLAWLDCRPAAPPFGRAARNQRSSLPQTARPRPRAPSRLLCLRPDRKRSRRLNAQVNRDHLAWLAHGGGRLAGADGAGG